MIYKFMYLPVQVLIQLFTCTTMMTVLITVRGLCHISFLV